MKTQSEILEWIASHGKRLARPGFPDPNHLANGFIRYFGTGVGATFDVPLDATGTAPGHEQNPPPSRIEVYGGDGALLYAEDV